MLIFQDITGLQMMLTLKLISFAYDYSTPVQASTSTSPSTSPREEIRQDTKRSEEVPPIPSLIAFLGFAFFFCTFLTGPAFEMRDYLGAVEGTAFQDSVGYLYN
jgi:lysophospholipid acyltransferase